MTLEEKVLTLEQTLRGTLDLKAQAEARLERAYATMERWLEECRGCKFCSDAARELKEKKMTEFEKGRLAGLRQAAGWVGGTCPNCAAAIRSIEGALKASPHPAPGEPAAD